MSEHFVNALSGLQKHQENDILLKILVTIRKDVQWPKNKDNITKLRKKGCLNQIVSTLQSQQRNILDVSLSILGNCCMDKDSTRDLVPMQNFFSSLNVLLKRHSQEDSINGRIFRIIGNISQHPDQWSTIIIDKKPQIFTHIVEFVKRASKDEQGAPDEKYSEATVTMAIRALRASLNSQTIISLVKTLGVLKAMGALFIKYSLEWEDTGRNESILNNIIRLLLEYSRFKYYQSILEMRNTERGDSLIYLANALVLAPKRVVKIVMNFIRICQLKSDLPISEICDKFIDILEKHSIVKEFNDECVEYLQCLCYLLEHPANRNSERCGKCLPLLIKVLQEFDQPTNSILECCVLIIATLNKCRFEDSLMLEQLKNNIISVLVEKLGWLVGTSNTLNLRHKDDKKRKYKNGDAYSMNNKRFGLKYEELKQPQSPSSSDDEIDFLTYHMYTRSPSPSSSYDSDAQLLTWSSPCSSPRSFYNDMTDSDDYSPVCSEADSSDFPLHLPSGADEGAPESDRCSDVLEIEENSNNPEHIPERSTSTSLKVRLLAEVVRLLKTYIKLKPAPPQLGSHKLLMALLKSCGCFDWTHSPNIDTIDVICRILDSHDYLIPLMQTDFIQDVYDLTEIQHNQWCTKCSQFQHIGQTILKKFSNLAESGVGKGDIAHKLLRGNGAIKQQLVLVIPYIVRNKGILGKLMLNCGGLEILMKLLRDETDLKRRSIKVLCAMASRKLAIANPKLAASGLNRPKIVADKYKEPEECADLVTFRLDDGSLLKARRDFLTQKSDFFGTLFNGSFKESTEEIISLHNVELKSLRCLLHLVRCIDKTDMIEVDVDLETQLDVIGLSDRYLMTDLCVSLSNSVEQFRISAETVPCIYRWSLESGTNLLRVESIAFALVGNIMDSDRFVMFENLFGLGYSDQLVEDIQKLLGRYLTGYDDGVIGKRKELKVELNRLKKRCAEDYL